MLLIRTSCEQLLKPLQIVNAIVERRHTLPILANLLFKRTGENNQNFSMGKLVFISTDLEMQITVSCPIDKIETSIYPLNVDRINSRNLNDNISLDEETITSQKNTRNNQAKTVSEILVTVAAKKLLDIIKAMPENEVELSLIDNKIKIISGNSIFTLQTLSATDFPIIKEINEFPLKFYYPQKAFKQLLMLTNLAMATHDIRPHLNGTLIVLNASEVSSVSTDGHRLAYNSIKNSQEASVNNECSVIIPRKTVLEIYKLLGETDAQIEILLAKEAVSAAVNATLGIAPTQASTQVKFIFKDSSANDIDLEIEILTKSIEGRFPNYLRVIPKIPNLFSQELTSSKIKKIEELDEYTYKSFLVKKTILQAGLQRATILTSDKFHGVNFFLEKNKLSIYSSNSNEEEAKEEILINYPWSNINISFSVAYLLDLLVILKVDEIQLSLMDANSAVLISIPGNQSFKYVLMPIRI